MLNVNSFDEHVAARLLDFFDAKSPWQRGLWKSGIVLTLKEALQASEAAAAGVLSDGSIQNLAGFAIVLAGKDAGIDQERKKLIQQALKTDKQNGCLVFNGSNFLTLEQLVGEVEKGYLERWATVVADTTRRPGPERTARSIAAHLLDSGFSSDFLHRWWTYKTRYETGTKTIAELVGEAHLLIERPFRDFELLIAFENAPPPSSNAGTAWMSNKDVSKWLREHGFDVSGVRQRGGIQIHVKARDPEAAVENAAETVDRIKVRVALGTYKRLVPIPSVWIAGEAKPLPLRLRRRRVEVHALRRENRLYAESRLPIVDAALELVAPLDAESPSPAVTGGWAAIETLLSGPGDPDRVQAADRMAALVACSFPRAELTALTYSLEKQGGPIAQQIAACNTNRDRGEVLVGLIKTGTALTFTSISDTAALTRIQALLAQPKITLRDIERHAGNCFRRLYRQRNMVVHWGKTDAVGLRSCLRTAAPLVGAGLDRIAHAAFVSGIEPLELAARASIRLETIGTVGAKSIIDLLE